MEVMPLQYKHMLTGPSLKVDLHTGAIAEGVLTFVINVAVLWIIVRGPRSPIVKTWLVAFCTVSLIMVGTAYTGPSMNPANVSYPVFLSFPILFPLDVLITKCCLLFSHRTRSRLLLGDSEIYLKHKF